MTEITRENVIRVLENCDIKDLAHILIRLNNARLDLVYELIQAIKTSRGSIEDET